MPLAPSSPAPRSRLKQHGFRLVVEMMGERDAVRVELRRALRGALRAPPPRGHGLAFPTLTLHALNGNPELKAEARAESRQSPAFGLRP